MGVAQGSIIDNRNAMVIKHGYVYIDDLLVDTNLRKIFKKKMHIYMQCVKMNQ